MALASSFRFADVFFVAVAAWILRSLFQAHRRRSKTTKLSGPRSSSLIFGVTKEVFPADFAGKFEKWAKEYGTVFQIPGVFGQRRIVLTDAKAVHHFFAHETVRYTQSSTIKKILISMVGKSVLSVDGDEHRRQRRTLAPAFSNAAIQSLVPIFFDSGYKVKAVWETSIESTGSGEAIIDVQKWMNRVSLDSMGIAGFGHDFGSLDGNSSIISETFDAFGVLKPSYFQMVLTLLKFRISFLQKIPDERARLDERMTKSLSIISNQLHARSKSEKEAGSDISKSIIGTLLKAENTDSQFHLSEEEVLSQMKLLLIAGYETTSITLTWALVQLSRHSEKQDRLRAELEVFAHGDPTYEQLTSGLPYLDAVFRETLRLNPPISQIGRVAACDDIIPLNRPITTASGELVDHIKVSKGSAITIPIRCVNQSEEIWGADAKEFKPERWLDGEAGLTARAKEMQGYHHIMSFVDGQRMCLGRAFAIAEFKSVMTVLIRNFTFEMRDGPDTKVEMFQAMLPRPKVSGEAGYALPLRVKRI